MKTLLLTRHAKTIPGEPGMSDFDRALAPRGSKDITLVAKELISFDFKPDLIVSSPALRARQTAELFARAFQYSPSQIRYLNYLYSYFDVNQLMEDLAQLDPKARFVQIIGHNPSIPEIGADLTGSFPDTLPTTGTLTIDFEVNEWEHVTKGNGMLSKYIFPSALRKSDV